MSSPSPTQPPPTQTPIPRPEYKPVLLSEQKQVVTPAHKTVRATPVRKRLGETPTARLIKNILRPPIKGLYYLSTWIRQHKLSSLGILLLLVASIGTTNYYMTHELPFGIAHDPFNFSYDGGKGEGTQVKSWLYALRDGDLTHLQLLNKDITQPPDPTQLIAQFSQTKTHLIWGDVNVIAVHQETDTTVDSFVEVPISTKGPGNTSKGILLWHFITASVNGQNLLLNVDLVSERPLQS